MKKGIEGLRRVISEANVDHETVPEGVNRHEKGKSYNRFLDGLPSSIMQQILRSDWTWHGNAYNPLCFYIKLSDPGVIRDFHLTRYDQAYPQFYKGTDAGKSYIEVAVYYGEGDYSNRDETGEPYMIIVTLQIVPFEDNRKGYSYKFYRGDAATHKDVGYLFYRAEKEAVEIIDKGLDKKNLQHLVVPHRHPRTIRRGNYWGGEDRVGESRVRSTDRGRRMYEAIGDIPDNILRAITKSRHWDSYGDEALPNKSIVFTPDYIDVDGVYNPDSYLTAFIGVSLDDNLGVEDIEIEIQEDEEFVYGEGHLQERDKALLVRVEKEVARLVTEQKEYRKTHPRIPVRRK